MRTFFFHYNKPASAQAGEPRMSVHFEGRCHIVKHVRCGPGCATAHRKQQPRCVMKGKATSVRVLNGTAVIT